MPLENNDTPPSSNDHYPSDQRISRTPRKCCIRFKEGFRKLEERYFKPIFVV